MQSEECIAILGAGSIGTAIAVGVSASGRLAPGQIILRRRRVELLEEARRQGFQVLDNNVDAVRQAGVLLVAVEPQQLDNLLGEIRTSVDPQRHTVISVVTGATIRQIRDRLGVPVPIVRAMPNTAISIRESMTCLAGDPANAEALDTARELFEAVGRTVTLAEEEMIAATALGACGIAFFLRAIRAASQGGIEIGFHSDDALRIAAQTARGAAGLVLESFQHPESEIDKVTTPRGCTISGLNQLEHGGFSSAMIRGIVTSAEKAAQLYVDTE